MNRWKILCLIAVLAVCVGCYAFATPTVPYSSYGCHFYDGQPTIGTAYTDKCACNPVNNYLAARVKIQYLDSDGIHYHTSNWSSWSTGENVTTSYIRAYASAGSYVNFI